MRALIVLAFVSSIAHADAPSGRYELSDDNAGGEFRGDKSCGIDRRQLLRVWPRIVIEFKKPSTVLVGGRPWVFVGVTKDLVMARRRERWNGLTVEAWFQRSGRSAAGGVIVVQYDPDGNVVCSDSLALGGTYTP